MKTIYRNRKLLDLARDQRCVMCHAEDGTVVAAHSNREEHGKGMGIKAHDCMSAWLCAMCHNHYDQGGADEQGGTRRVHLQSDPSYNAEDVARRPHPGQMSAVVLTPDEMLCVVSRTSVMFEAKMANLALGRIRNRRYAKDIDDYSMVLIRCIAEAAVCKLLGIRYSPNVRIGGDSGIDLVVKGIKLQISATFGDHGPRQMLSVNDIHACLADIFVQAVLTKPSSVDLIGAVSKEQFVQRMEIKDWGYGPRHCVAREHLRPIESMVKFLKELA